MPHGVRPRYGSMQFWPRKRSKRNHAKIRTWAGNMPTLLGFAGYKVGMTHLMITDNKATSDTKGAEIFCPVTIVECPPIKVAAIRFYANSTYGVQPLSTIFSENLDKELGKRICVPKKAGKKVDDIKEFDDVVLIVYTQPKLTTLGKKIPEIFEIPIGGKKEEKLKHAKEMLGKEITIEEIFKEGQQMDIHSITKGHGFQGPHRRFGIGRTSHKSEKHTKNPGSLGGWSAQGHVMYRVAHAGQTGMHQRTEYNKQLIKISKDVKEIEQKGGFLHYGNVNNTYILISGSIGGHKKRLIMFSHSIRPNKHMPKDAPQIVYISKESKQ
jgi:large subunit ribosomal protein L3